MNLLLVILAPCSIVVSFVVCILTSPALQTTAQFVKTYSDTTDTKTSLKRNTNDAFVSLFQAPRREGRKGEDKSPLPGLVFVLFALSFVSLAEPGTG